ncbi:MAG: hypothetical protein JKY96_03710 [Phycisphaerales bacterium]|nr:hypothetical protein [Phycisphaerales bacterium]
MNIDAKPIFDTADSVVEAGRAIALKVNDALADDTRVSLSFKGIFAASSSFFNILFLDILNANSGEVLMTQLQLEYNSKVQESVGKRSLDAVLSSGGNGSVRIDK